jgi:WD40 repeat protein
VVFNPARNRLVVSFRDGAATAARRHAFVLYRIVTVDDFRLDPIAQVDNPHPGAVTAAAFAPNGRILATGADDGSVALWDATQLGANWKPLATVDGVSGYRVFALAFRPDWRVLAAVTWDKTRPNLLLIDVDAGKLLRAVRLERELLAVAWSPDGRTLLTGGGSGKIQAWDAEALLNGN